jgi:hypothetical protein
MLRRTLVLLALAAAASVAGCSANGEFNPVGQGAEKEMTPTQLAAFAATAKYPDTQPLNGLKVAAIVNRDKGTIKIYNFSGQPIHNARVWINKAYVAKIDGVAPQNKATVEVDKLYGPFGNNFASQKDTPISSVQLQTDEGLFDVEGPAQE